MANILTKIFGKREAARPFGSMRSFAACEVSQVLGAWKWDGGFSNQEISASLAVMRSRSRDVHKNNGDFKKFFDLFKANVVGAYGFTFASEAVKTIEGMELDRDASFAIEYHFRRWARSKEMADVTGVKNLASIFRLAALNWARDGECFIWVNRHAQNRYGLSLRIIRPDACPEWFNGTTPDGKWVRNGVEVEPETYKPLAFYFDGKAEDNTTPVVWQGRAHHLMRIPAKDILHLFTQNDECQTRGIPLTHAALRTGKMLDEFNFSELVAARDEANTLGVFHAPLGREQEIAALNEDTETTGKLQVSRPGQKLVLPAGWDYKSDTPQHPNREVTPFKSSMKRDMANGLSVEYANFANDWSGVNYSSVRAGTLAERDMWMMYQEDFIDMVCTPIFLIWLDSFLRLSISGKYSIADYERMAEHSFQGRRWAWVDPLKDVNAAAVAVAHHWKTDKQIAAEYGCDIDDNLEEAKRVADARKEYGLQTVAPMNTPKNEEEENGKEE